jgi:outer membrane lipase/esterase
MMTSGSGFRAGLAALLLGAALVAGCGGGTTSERAYKPDRVIAFGDETSLLLPDGRKYSVNSLNAFDAPDCSAFPIWVQTVASAFSYVFAECNPSASTEVKALMRAAVGAKADDLKTQIDAQVARTGAEGGVRNLDLVTVLAGANDILELYAQFPGRNEADLTTEARARGERLAAQVNRIVNLGGRVIVSTIPDMGKTPFATAEKAAKSDTDRVALLTRLSAAFNGRIRVNILNDGRFVGLVLADEMVQTMVISPASFGLTDATTVACAVALPACSNKTLVGTAVGNAWLWADSTRMAAGGHARLGSLAAQRALNNPF